MSRQSTIEHLGSHRPSVLPSLLLCDFGNLAAEMEMVEQAGATSLHLDVMDGVFVPNFTYGMTVVDAVNRVSELPLDVHLMMVQPEKYIEQFAQAGADLITIHAEAVDDAPAVLEAIRRLDVASGIAINPGTQVAEIEKAIPHADLVLVMSVQPGFGGQSFNEQVLPKFEEIRNLPGGENVLLEIDGGINKSTIGTATAAGAELLVAGSAIFKQADYTVAVNDLMSEAKCLK
ncbi:MAG: ribulose-phosphate 3-epimerase [Planctomycetota bacterium]